jgi:hypothetical protein
MHIDILNLALNTVVTGSFFALQYYLTHRKKNEEVSVLPESSSIKIDKLATKLPPSPVAGTFIREIRGHWMEDHVTVTYGRKDEQGNIIDFRKIVCIPIPDHLPMSEVRNTLKVNEVINSPLPPGWENYLLSRTEAS